MTTSVTPLVSPSGIAIRDTSAHTYRTDPTLLALIPLGDAQPPIRVYTLWISNPTDQALTVQPIGNKDDTGGNPDYLLGAAQTVAAGATALLVMDFSSYATRYVSVRLSFATAPTTGATFGKLDYYF